MATNEDARRAAADAALCRGYHAIAAPELIQRRCHRGGPPSRADAPGFGARRGACLGRGDDGNAPAARPGRGGRCQSLALSAAAVLKGHDNVHLLAAAGTDGADGPTEDAGALVDGGTVARGEGLGLDAPQMLATADAGSFLAASGDLVDTGPTGTNVMDIVVGLRSE